MKKYMKGLWLEEGKLTFRDDLPVPEPPHGEALIKILLAGICSTDLELVKGYYPYQGVLGHEFVGMVVSAPDEPSWVGKRIVGEINAFCGVCSECKAGRTTHCINRTVLGIIRRDGAFAEYCTLPIENLHIVPPNVPNDAAVFTEPLAAVLEIQQQVNIRPADRVVLIGSGRLGLLVAYSIVLIGCDLKVVVRRERPKKLLAEKGIHTISVDDVMPRMADIVIDTSGSAGGLLLAKKALRPRGTLVLKSTYQGNTTINLSEFVVDEITLVGSRCGPFPPALNLLNQSLIDTRNLIDGRYPLKDGSIAFEKAAIPGTLKILLEP